MANAIAAIVLTILSAFGLQTGASAAGSDDPRPPAVQEIPATKGTGEMTRRSGAFCHAVFDPATEKRVYICAMKSSADCVPLTEPYLRNYPGARYEWLCPAPNPGS